MNLLMARVVATHPESYAVDVVIMDDGRRLPGVPVLSPMAGGNCGIFDLPVPTVTDPEKPYESRNTDDRDIFAMVSFVNQHIPVVVGFLYPQVAQCLFTEKNLRINRHASDVYSTLNEGGEFEYYHPSGTFIRIGDSLDHADLTGADYDKKWNIEKNTDKLPGIAVHIENINGIQTTIVLDAEGNITVTNVGDTSIETGGNTSISTTGTTDITSVGDITISSSGTVHMSAG